MSDPQNWFMLLTKIAMFGSIIGIVEFIQSFVRPKVRRAIALRGLKYIRGTVKYTEIFQTFIPLITIRPFSLQSFYLSLSASTLFFAFVFVTQFFIIGYDIQNIFQLPNAFSFQMICLAVCLVAANYLIDFISFNQTLILLQIINYAKRLRDALLLAFTDILSSIGIFTLLFSLAIMLFFKAFYTVSVQSEYRITLTEIAAELASEDEDVLEFAIDVGLSSTQGYKFFDYALFIEDRLARTGMALAPDCLNCEALGPLFSELLLVPHDESTDGIDVNVITDAETIRPTVTIEYGREVSPFISDYYYAEYSAIYSVVDRVQDEFGLAFSLDPIFLRLNQVKDVMNLQLSDQSLNADRAIVFESDESEVIAGLSNYNPWFADYRSAEMLEIPGNIPLSTFLWSSLALTLLAYLFVISIVILRIFHNLFRFTRYATVKYLDVFQRPITIYFIPVYIILILSLVFV